MSRLSKKQLMEVILPNPLNYRGTYFRVMVREDPPVILHAKGADVNHETVRVIEFEKSEDGREWLLSSMPEY